MHEGLSHVRLIYIEMKNLAKLTLFFSLVFVTLFLAAIVLSLLSSWIEFARFVPLETRPGVDIPELAWNALPAAFFLAVLLTLSYTARRIIPAPLSIITILVLGSVFYMGLSFGISRAGAIQVSFRNVSSLQAEPGLMLSRLDNVMILLRESTDVWGPRVVSLPGQPLIYHEVPMGDRKSVV